MLLIFRNTSIRFLIHSILTAIIVYGKSDFHGVGIVVISIKFGCCCCCNGVCYSMSIVVVVAVISFNRWMLNKPDVFHRTDLFTNNTKIERFVNLTRFIPPLFYIYQTVERL